MDTKQRCPVVEDQGAKHGKFIRNVELRREIKLAGAPAVLIRNNFAPRTVQLCQGGQKQRIFLDEAEAFSDALDEIFKEEL